MALAAKGAAAHDGARNVVLCLGRIYCDLIFTGAPSLPVLGREVFSEALDIIPGGGAPITAGHFAAVGRPAALLARLGVDGLSESILPAIEAAGIDLRFLERSPSAGPQVTAAMVLGGERAFLSRRAGAARPATLDAALTWPQARHLHIAEYASLHEMPGLIAQAKAHGLTVSLDPSWDETLIHAPDLLEKCAGVDVFLPNMEEARAITGASDPFVALETLARRFPVVALKVGPDGALGSMHEETARRPARAVRAVDTTGAGDAFNAGFLHAWLEGSGLDACLDAGMTQGAIAVQTVGGLPPR
ncbi:ribokinase [Salmonella enterica subsp. enterica]|nr:ribokinase [Salmonella enterica subsp. enterica serovar Enteritidis]